jgi:hypothetical protein
MMMCRIALLLVGASPTLRVAHSVNPVPIVQSDRNSARPKPNLQREEVDDKLVTRLAVCRWGAAPPALDGKLNDRCWHNARVID